MGDVKDILGVPREGLAPPPSKSKKKDEPKLVKPKGMSRWVLARCRVVIGAGGRGLQAAASRRRTAVQGRAWPLPPAAASRRCRHLLPPSQHLLITSTLRGACPAGRRLRC